MLHLFLCIYHSRFNPSEETRCQGQAIGAYGSREVVPEGGRRIVLTNNLRLYAYIFILRLARPIKLVRMPPSFSGNDFRGRLSLRTVVTESGSSLGLVYRHAVLLLAFRIV